MSDLTVRFGNGLSAHQWYLPGTPIALLPHPVIGDHPPVDNALSSEPFAPPWNQTVLFGDRVLADTKAGGVHLFDVVGRWNSVKNAAAASSAAEDLRFDGFVQVDATVGSATADASHLDLIGAKRGNLVTGAGDDAINIAFVTNDYNAAASNAFRVHSGGGNDVVTIAGLDFSAKIAAGDPTYHYGLQADGAATTAFVDLSAGNDVFSGGAERDVVYPGAGQNVIDTGAGDDVAVFPGQRADYQITTDKDNWVTTVVGPEGSATLADVDHLRFADAVLNLTHTIYLAEIVRGVGGFKIIGEHIGDDAGWSVSGAGDLNGDGQPDLLIGAPSAEGGKGAVYVVYGSYAGNWVMTRSGGRRIEAG